MSDDNDDNDDGLANIAEQLTAEEEDLGIEWVGEGKGLNRAARRAKVRLLQRLTRRPEALLTLQHPLTGAKTPYGVKVVAERRAKNKRARAAQKRNRGNT